MFHKEEQLFHYLDSMEEAFFLLDPKKGFVDCNKKALSLFELDSKEAFLKLNPVILSPEFQYNGTPSSEMAGEVMQKAIEEGSILFQWNHKRLNGAIFPTSIILGRVKIGHKTLLLGIVHDVSLSNPPDDEMVKREKEYQSTLDNLSIGIVVHAADTSILLSNPAAQEILGLTKDQMNGKQVIDPEWSFVDESGGKLDPKDYPVSIVMKNKELLKNRTFGILRSDRNYTTWVLVNAVPVFDEEGFLKKVVVNFYDITELKTIEEELIHSRKMDAIGQLAGGVAHDFNNMLAGIMSSAELLKSRFSAESIENTYIDMILHSSQRAADLNSKLLSFARKGKAVSTPINVHAVLDDAVGILERSVDKRIRITTRKTAKYHTVTGDNSQLQNAFLNLCINAANAMPGGGEIFISTENIDLDDSFCRTCPFNVVPGNYVYIEVRDSGVGIPPENLKKIFEPFFTTRPKGKGTGLGLASVYGTLQQHHGAISVYSEEGVGTSFHLYLPISEGVVPLYKKEEKIVSGSGRILLVDDEEIIRITAKEMLKDMNYEVLTAQNGQEALELYRVNSSRIDLVILDMVMPDMNGREVFPLIREINPEAKVIISSGFTKFEDLNAMNEQGLCGFIRKPYRKSELSRIVSDTLQ